MNISSNGPRFIEAIQDTNISNESTFKLNPNLIGKGETWNIGPFSIRSFGFKSQSHDFYQAKVAIKNEIETYYGKPISDDFHQTYFSSSERWLGSFGSLFGTTPLTLGELRKFHQQKLATILPKGKDLERADSLTGTDSETDSDHESTNLQQRSLGSADSSSASIVHEHNEPDYIIIDKASLTEERTQSPVIKIISAIFNPRSWFKSTSSKSTPITPLNNKIISYGGSNIEKEGSWTITNPQELQSFNAFLEGVNTSYLAKQDYYIASFDSDTNRGFEHTFGNVSTNIFTREPNYLNPADNPRTEGAKSILAQIAKKQFGSTTTPAAINLQNNLKGISHQALFANAFETLSLVNPSTCLIQGSPSHATFDYSLEGNTIIITAKGIFDPILGNSIITNIDGLPTSLGSDSQFASGASTLKFSAIIAEDGTLSQFKTISVAGSWKISPATEVTITNPTVMKYGDNDLSVKKSGTWKIADSYNLNIVNNSLNELLKNRNTDESLQDIGRGHTDEQAQQKERQAFEDSISTIATQIFPSEIEKGMKLKDSFMGILNQGILAGIGTVFMEGHPPEEACCISGAMKFEKTISLTDKNEITIWAEGIKNEGIKKNSIIYKNKEKYLLENQPTTGTVSIKIIATVGQNGSITNLRCDSMEGTWNIEDPKNLE